jgi:ribonuclease HI
MPSKKKKYYAYFVPDGPQGVTDDWATCEKIVKGTPGARYKAFDGMWEADAWVAHGAVYEAKLAPKLEPGIYFDAGTGRGHGVEVSVTDEHGKNLLHKVLSKSELNKFGKRVLKNNEATNNYGELLALRYALLIAKKTGAKKIFGDSRLVIDYWSKWRVKRKDLPTDTVELADEVAEMREKFEKTGGMVARVGGAHNPADLGFH